MLLAALFAGLAWPAKGEALAIVQHPLSAPAASIAEGAGGLLVGGGVAGASVSAVATTPAFALIPGPSGPHANHVGPGPDGNPWFISGVSERVAAGEVTYPALFEVTATAVVLRFKYPLPWDQPYVPGEFVTGPDHALWIADWGLAGAIERYEPGGQLTVYRLPSGGTPIGIVSGPEDSLWFTDTTGRIGRITTNGEITENLIEGGDVFATWGFAGPYGIAVGPDGALWFAEQALGRIGRMTTTGQLQEFAIPRPPGLAAGVAATPAPRHLARGSDGAMWFTDPGDGSIGRVTMGGELSEYPIQGAAAGSGPASHLPPAVPDEIAIGPEGAPWFTEIGSPQLGSVTTDSLPRSSTAMIGVGSPLLAARVRSRCARHRHASHGRRSRGRGASCSRRRRSK
jgi:streptogramin lyase